MSSQAQSIQMPHSRQGSPMWSSRLAFILAATGSAVGLGNIWKFPYITGENGGGAFVIVYLLCIAMIGLPILIAEIYLGRRGRMSPINTMKYLARADGSSPHWKYLGWMGVLAAFLILSFYSVIGGWSIAYVGHAVSGDFNLADSATIGAMFGSMLQSPSTLLTWHSVFVLMVVAILSGGIRGGLEKTVNILMPLLFLLLLVMVGYAMSTSEFMRAVDFLFTPDFSKLSTEGVLTALGHAFFTLSLGSCAMMAYGSFLPKEVSIVKTSVAIAVVDTLVALLAGLAIFPLVFANGMEPGAGPGLIFQTLPLAFGQMPAGTLFASLFFFLLLVAAITSAISMLEPAIEWLEEQRGINRRLAAVIAGVAVWSVGLLSVFSLNTWADFYPLSFMPVFAEKTFFDVIDYLTANIMLPLGGLFIVLYVGRCMKPEILSQELGLKGMPFRLLMFLIRYLSPALVMVVFIYNLI
ncbi:sodium-dependent transporter [Marinobacterium jannaschii]|uniref:sodium-dependent transporter n=1 Tax=Marinobacterium jannaschii TaxID=64970 RepID=UPI0004809507|nr:sodium-dependent transporter [Marinobacterium jannaschii]